MHVGVQYRHSSNGSSEEILATSHSTYGASGRVSLADVIASRF